MRHITINFLITHAPSHSLCKGQLSLFINASKYGKYNWNGNAVRQYTLEHARLTKGRHKNEQKMHMKKSSCPEEYSDNITQSYLNCSAKGMRLSIQYCRIYTNLNKKQAVHFATTIILVRILILHLLCYVDAKIILTGTLRFFLDSAVTATNQLHTASTLFKTLQP